MDFKGKVALVTGGGRGIGRATALALARGGADILVNYLENHRAAEEVVEAIQAIKGKAVAVQANEIGVQLNIPVYQGGAVNSRTREARSRFQEATEQLQQEIRAAEFETRNAYRGVMTDIAQVRALGKSLESTEIAVEAEEAGFEVGTRTIVDVLNATRENYLARLNYARARYLYVVDQLRLKKAAGILSREDMLGVNETLDPIKSGP